MAAVAAAAAAAQAAAPRPRRPRRPPAALALHVPHFTKIGLFGRSRTFVTFSNVFDGFPALDGRRTAAVPPCWDLHLNATRHLAQAHGKAFEALAAAGIPEQVVDVLSIYSTSAPSDFFVARSGLIWL